MLSDHGVTEFTTFSLSGDAPEESDRRGGQRYMSVLQTGKIVTPTHQELCLIRNISSGGMMADIFAPMNVGEFVSVEFKAGKRVEGAIRWINNDRSGIEFLERIDVHDVLSSNRTRLAPRAPRLSVDGMAVVTIGEDSHSVPVLDISQGGIKIEACANLEPGLDVIISTDGLPIRASVVRWVDDGMAGISFNRIMPLNEVAYWAANQEA